MKQEILSQLFDESNHVFGVKSKPRNQDPSMFQILQWQDKEQPWDFKKNHVNPQHETEKSLYAIRMMHEPISEAHDQYRKIITLNNGMVVQDVDKATLKAVEQSLNQPKQQAPQTQPGIQVHGEQDYKQSADWYPKIQTMYRDQYQVKEIMSHNDLMHQLELNCKDFHGKYKLDQNGRAVKIGEGEGEAEAEEEVLSEEEEEDVPESASAYKMSQKMVKRARKLDPNNPEDAAKLERRRQRIKKMAATTRWLPNTSFTTYFGKPSWGPYGYQNVNPTVGGIVYGQHMLSHNVQPHRLHNHPHHAQSYNNALRYARNVAEVIPEPPRNCREEDRLNPEQVEELKRRNPLTNAPFEDIKKTITDTKGRSQVTDLHIKKPDLVNSLRFASEDGSTVPLEERKVQKPGTAQNKKQANPKQSNQAVKSEPADVKKGKPARAASARPVSKPLAETNKNHDTAKKGSKKVAFSQTNQQQQQLDDSLTIPDKSSKKFIDEMKQKKERSNRLTPKVNEVNPSLLVQSQAPSQPRVLNPDLIDTMNIDDMNPPHLYLSQMTEQELNPKNYKHIPSEWLHRIPYAGKKKQQSIAAKECFDFGY